MLARLRTATGVALLAAGFLLTPATPARADDSPMLSIFKSTVFGGLAGLALGGAVELVADSSDGDAAKWGFVAGVFFGFGYGVWHETRKPDSQGFLHGDADGWQLSAPTVELRLGGEAAWEIRSPLASLRF
jgi:hypothetical protein